MYDGPGPFTIGTHVTRVNGRRCKNGRDVAEETAGVYARDRSGEWNDDKSVVCTGRRNVPDRLKIRVPTIRAGERGRALTSFDGGQGRAVQQEQHQEPFERHHDGYGKMAASARQDATKGSVWNAKSTTGFGLRPTAVENDTDKIV